MKNVFILPFLLLFLLLNSCGGKSETPENPETIEDYAPATLRNKSISLVLRNCDLADKVRFDIDKTLVSCQLSSGETFEVSKQDYEYGKEEKNIAFVYLEYFDTNFFYAWELTLTFKDEDSGTFEGLLEYKGGLIDERENINGTFSISNFEKKESSWENVTISKPEVSEITAESVVIQGTIEDKKQKLTSRGFSIGTTSSPKEGKHIECETNEIDGELTGLSSNTTYYVWLYAAISNEIKYGESVSFTTDKSTLEKIELSTPKVQDITTNSATVTGTIYGNDDKKISEIGVCFGTKDEPTINDKCLKSSSDNINITLNELDANTTYYVRLYAKYNDEVKYGKVASFSTAKESEVNEDDYNVKIAVIACDKGNHNVACSIESKDEKSAKYTPQGVCYSTSPNPTITDYTVEKGKYSDGISIDNLKSGTIYYIRPYFIKDDKVYYFKETSFETIGGKIKLAPEFKAKKYTIHYEIELEGTYQFVLHNYLGQKKEHLGYAEKGKGSFETKHHSLYYGLDEWEHVFNLRILRVDDNSSASYRYVKSYDY